MNYTNEYFMLSSECALVKGLKRGVVIDYPRSELYFISHDYIDLLEKMDRKMVSEIEEKIEEESKDYFQEFLNFIYTSEIGFFTTEPERYPKISNNLTDDFIILKDIIVEIDAKHFSLPDFKTLCQDLTELKCKDIQIRFLSKFDKVFLEEILEIISFTDILYVEIHCTYNDEMKENLMWNFIESNRLLMQLYIYGYSETKKVSVVNKLPTFDVELGKIFYINHAFNSGDCCGLITENNLTFTNLDSHNLLKNKNGCLDRKIAIDKFGNIKNCPSLKNIYGNMHSSSIKKVIEDDEFRKYWNISKDQISVCKVCEFRYNCTDCRAFLQDPQDIYSKPAKCSYDPSTCKWEQPIYA